VSGSAFTFEGLRIGWLYGQLPGDVTAVYTVTGTLVWSSPGSVDT